MDTEDKKCTLLYEYMDILLDLVKFRIISLEDVEGELEYSAKQLPFLL